MYDLCHNIDYMTCINSVLNNDVLIKVLLQTGVKGILACREVCSNWKLLLDQSPQLCTSKEKTSELVLKRGELKNSLFYKHFISSTVLLVGFGASLWVQSPWPIGIAAAAIKLQDLLNDTTDIGFKVYELDYELKRGYNKPIPSLKSICDK